MVFHPHRWQIALKCPFLHFRVMPLKKPWPLKVLKRTLPPSWASNPATPSQRRRQSWRDWSRRMLTSGERLMKWPNDTSNRPAPKKASCWRWPPPFVSAVLRVFCFLSCHFRTYKLPGLFCYFCMTCNIVFRGLFPWRRCERETINSCLLRSKNWKPWGSSWQPGEER